MEPLPENLSELTTSRFELRVQCHGAGERNVTPSMQVSTAWAAHGIPGDGVLIEPWGGVDWRGSQHDIDIGGAALVAQRIKGVSADQQVLDPVVVKSAQEQFQVIDTGRPRGLLRAVGHQGRPLWLARWRTLAAIARASASSL